MYETLVIYNFNVNLRISKTIQHRYSIKFICLLQLFSALLLAQQFSDIHREVDTRLTKTEDLLNNIDGAKGLHGIQKEKLDNIQDNILQLQTLIVNLRVTG